MSPHHRARTLLRAAAFVLALPIYGRSESVSVPERYQPFIVYNVDRRGIFEKALNVVGQSRVPVGRSFALIAGVTQYPNMKPATYQTLQAAKVDLDNLERYLRDEEFFDVVVVLKDGAMNYDNLQYFLGTYFPNLLARSPHSRFLFAYSGHGYAVSSSEVVRGYLLTSAANTLTDESNRLSMDVLRVLMGPVVDAANHVLVLINACEAGAFRGRSVQGAPLPFDPDGKDAYAIMSSRANEQSLQLPEIGPGSVFFEKFFAALGGAADKNPADGIVTFHELSDYMRSEVRSATASQQNTIEGDISNHGSTSDFYLLNRSRQIHLGNAPPWNPIKATTFGGEEAESLLEEGKSAYNGQRYEAALHPLEGAADKGNSEAMTYLGLMYDRGYGVAQDYNEARQWYQKAADKGNALAMKNIGNLYVDGHGVPQDYQQARQWWQKSADAGSADAVNNLATSYSNGQGVPRDYQKARDLFRKAADAGSAMAMANLGTLYERGQGGPQDYPQALYWYQKGADAGNTNAMNDLGALYEAGHGVPQDYQQASQWYQKGGDAGSKDAMRSLGRLYEVGHGVPKDYQLARQWYQRSADAGNGDAMSDLGLLYEQGRGVPQDYQEARQWYQKGADAGSGDAMSHFGDLYESGHGVAQDYHLAAQWYRRAAAAGGFSIEPVSWDMKGMQYELGIDVAKDYRQARLWYERAAEAGNVNAMQSLGVRARPKRSAGLPAGAAVV